MKKNIQEMILLYNFTDEMRLTELKNLLESMKIKVILVDKKEHYQKIGYLFGLKGFSKIEPTDEKPLDFEYELMMFHNFSKSRLDSVLKNMREKNIQVPICKAVVTTFNRFWSITRVCHALEKEHLAMRKQKE
ncbi:DUF3783 domain-containing protein [uncultured Megamonas sp.]|uniref:DUF3783 domain-containing protein n=1 Tax=Megamonas funiformis TaxID=437897 RepID=UPI0025D17A4E|nr:DUF3783 domain-containing protein [uncultured Megamonas sp.]